MTLAFIRNHFTGNNEHDDVTTSEDDDEEGLPKTQPIRKETETVRERQQELE